MIITGWIGVRRSQCDCNVHSISIAIQTLYIGYTSVPQHTSNNIRYMDVMTIISSVWWSKMQKIIYIINQPYNNTSILTKQYVIYTNKEDIQTLINFAWVIQMTCKQNRTYKCNISCCGYGYFWLRLLDCTRFMNQFWNCISLNTST